MNATTTTIKRGLACCTPSVRQRVARSGGKAVSKRKGHMAKIGAKGGSHPKGMRAMMI